MKKAILITTLLIASFASYSQITMIKTDSLSFNNKTVPSKYKFFYNESFLSFGKLEEETTDLTAYSIKKTVIDGKYTVIVTEGGDMFSVSKELNRVKLISTDGKIFNFN